MHFTLQKIHMAFSIIGLNGFCPASTEELLSDCPRGNDRKVPGPASYTTCRTADSPSHSHKGLFFVPHTMHLQEVDSCHVSACHWYGGYALALHGCTPCGHLLSGPPCHHSCLLLTAIYGLLSTLQQSTLEIHLEVSVAVLIRGQRVVPNAHSVGVGLSECYHTQQQLEHQRICTHTTCYRAQQTLVTL
jgi:hypothetical protein